MLLFIATPETVVVFETRSVESGTPVCAANANELTSSERMPVPPIPSTWPGDN